MSLTKDDAARDEGLQKLAEAMLNLSEMARELDTMPRARPIDPAKPFIVKDKYGKPWAFSTQEDADNFKRAEGLL